MQNRKYAPQRKNDNIYYRMEMNTHNANRSKYGKGLLREFKILLCDSVDYTYDDQQITYICKREANRRQTQPQAESTNREAQLTPH